MANIIFAGMLFLFGLLYYRGSTHIPRNMLEDPVGASGFPRALAIVITLLALALLAQEFMTWRRRVGATASGEKSTFQLRNLRPTLLLLLTIVAFLALFDTLGYVLALVLMLLAVFFQSGMRVGWQPFAVAIGGALAFRLMFGEVLGVRFPPGLLSYFLPT